MRERRRYRANIPTSAWPGGREPRQRRTRRSALRDVADGIERHVRVVMQREDFDALLWQRWSFELAAGIANRPAPDGTAWGVTTVIDYV